MTNIIVHLIVPFTFCDEGEYLVRIWHDTTIRIKHVQSDEGVEKIKGMKIVGSPKVVPDDPHGLYYISEVELKFPVGGQEAVMDLAMNDNKLNYFCVRYLNRLAEVIRFATHRYWTRMVTQFDVDVFKIETEDENRREHLMSAFIGFNQGFTFFPIPVYEQASKKGLIDTILKNGLKLQLSNNLLLDSISNFHSGKFLESVILANISLEVFVEEFMTEKFRSEGNGEQTVRELVDDLFDGNFHKTMRKAFFNDITESDRIRHEIWIKFENLRSKERQVMHPRTKKLLPEESNQALLDFIAIREWIMSLSYEKERNNIIDAK